MRPKTCPECHQFISSQAFACPDCGYRLNHTFRPLKGANIWKLITGIVIVFGCLFLMVWLGQVVFSMIISWVGNSVPCCS